MIVVVDYGMGNLKSVAKAVNRITDEKVLITSRPKEVIAASRLILPGVGHFGKAMANINKFDLLDALKEVVVERQIPVLGICLGMQLFASGSDEAKGLDGLGWIDGTVSRFIVQNPYQTKVPHIGWNSVTSQVGDHVILRGLNGAEFYFVHAYHYSSSDDTIGSTPYEYEFPSIVGKGNIVGTQFHPEKSHRSGQRLLENFLSM